MNNTYMYIKRGFHHGNASSCWSLVSLLFTNKTRKVLADPYRPITGPACYPCICVKCRLKPIQPT